MWNDMLERMRVYAPGLVETYESLSDDEQQRVREVFYETVPNLHG